MYFKGSGNIYIYIRNWLISVQQIGTISEDEWRVDRLSYFMCFPWNTSDLFLIDSTVFQEFLNLWRRQSVFLTQINRLFSLLLSSTWVIRGKKYFFPRRGEVFCLGIQKKNVFAVFEKSKESRAFHACWVKGAGSFSEMSVPVYRENRFISSWERRRKNLLQPNDFSAFFLHCSQKPSGTSFMSSREY